MHTRVFLRALPCTNHHQISKLSWGKSSLNSQPTDDKNLVKPTLYTKRFLGIKVSELIITIKKVRKAYKIKESHQLLFYVKEKPV